ncbi:sushi, nidogen and EGF-like domain-containing protein 1 [Danio aesculapii]|uniref:sushi, nidogen and EGF-like domain-containing protein 1 n=1 Tax=Danio aesculapii TaxID=1142201 RepID=UPI0024BF94C1|nr:sushi, nidogen and EGF-like domain-containing protein 1 [Danio aesculapii]
MRLFLVSSHLLMFLSLLDLSRAQTAMPIETTTPETTIDTTTTETTTDTTTTETTTDTTTPETTTDTTTPETTTDTTTPETTTDTTIPETTTFSTDIASTTAWTAPAIFYPFGSSAGDSEHIEFGSETYKHVAFSTPFTYFGRRYSNIYVNNNGLLTFNQALEETLLYPFPTYGNEDYIATLWTELDDMGIGKYWYQEYTNGSVLDRATQDINQYFPNRGFTASWVFVVTWDYVITQDINVFNLHSEPAITFQAVLISGGGLSFILMNYGNCAAVPFSVEAGYDTINSTDYNVILYEDTGSSIPNLKNTTNVNVPGRWAFLVNNGTENIIGLQINLRSFLDLTQTENIQSVLQLIKQELVRQGVSSQFGLKLRKLEKIWP